MACGRSPAVQRHEAMELIQPRLVDSLVNALLQGGQVSFDYKNIDKRMTVNIDGREFEFRGEKPTYKSITAVLASGQGARAGPAVKRPCIIRRSDMVRGFCRRACPQGHARK